VPDVLERPVAPAGRIVEIDERAVRRTLLDQVARLEGELASVFCATWSLFASSSRLFASSSRLFAASSCAW